MKHHSLYARCRLIKKFDEFDEKKLWTIEIPTNQERES